MRHRRRAAAYDPSLRRAYPPPCVPLDRLGDQHVLWQDEVGASVPTAPFRLPEDAHCLARVTAQAVGTDE